MLALIVSARARADIAVPPPPLPSPPFAIGAGLSGTVGSWRYTHGDSSGSTGAVFAGLAIEPRYRVVPELTLGVLGVAATALGSDGVGGSDGTATYDRRVYRAAAVARLWPWPEATVAPFLSADVGAIAVDTSVVVTGNVPLELEPTGAEVAATFGGRAGVEIALTERLGLDLEAGLLLATFDRPSTTFAPGHYYDRAWWSGGLSVAYRFGD